MQFSKRRNIFIGSWWQIWLYQQGLCYINFISLSLMSQKTHADYTHKLIILFWPSLHLIVFHCQYGNISFIKNEYDNNSQQIWLYYRRYINPETTHLLCRILSIYMLLYWKDCFPSIYSLQVRILIISSLFSCHFLKY